MPRAGEADTLTAAQHSIDTAVYDAVRTAVIRLIRFRQIRPGSAGPHAARPALAGQQLGVRAVQAGEVRLVGQGAGRLVGERPAALAADVPAAGQRHDELPLKADAFGLPGVHASAQHADVGLRQPAAQCDWPGSVGVPQVRGVG
jgi:hypothetical protein